MSTTTTHYGFVKPELTDPVSPVPFNNSFDVIDNTLYTNLTSMQSTIDAALAQVQAPWELIKSTTLTKTYAGSSVATELSVDTDFDPIEYDEICFNIKNPKVVWKAVSTSSDAVIRFYMHVGYSSNRKELYYLTTNGHPTNYLEHERTGPNGSYVFKVSLLSSSPSYQLNPDGDTEWRTHFSKEYFLVNTDGTYYKFSTSKQTTTGSDTVRGYSKVGISATGVEDRCGIRSISADIEIFGRKFYPPVVPSS